MILFFGPLDHWNTMTKILLALLTFETMTGAASAHSTRSTTPPGRSSAVLQPTAGCTTTNYDARGNVISSSWRDWSRRHLITFREMRASGVRSVVVFCADYTCSHSITMDAYLWPDDLRLSDIEDRFTCSACGKRGADVRPDCPNN